MKTYLSLLFLSLLVVFSCSNSSPTKVYPYDIQISEVPIVINESCLARSVYTRLDTENSRSGLTMEVFLDSTYLIREDLSKKRGAIRIDLPEDGKFRNLNILIKNGEKVLEEKTIPFEYVSQNDIVEFIKYNIAETTPIHFLERGCWPDYNGIEIPARENLQLISTKEVKTKIRGKSFKRTITLRDVKLRDIDNGEEFEINPELSFSFGGLNHLNLKNSIVTISKDEELDGISKFKENIQKENGILRQTKPISYRLMLSSPGGSKPSYTVIGFEYGKFIKAKILDCNLLDTLSSNSLILPDFIQLELDCKDSIF